MRRAMFGVSMIALMACDVGVKPTEIVRNESSWAITGIELKSPCFQKSCQVDGDCAEFSSSSCDVDMGFCTQSCAPEYGPNLLATTLELGCSEGCACDPDCEGVELEDDQKFEHCACDASATQVPKIDCGLYEVRLTEESGATCTFDVPTGTGNYYLCFAHQRWILSGAILGDCENFPAVE